MTDHNNRLLDIYTDYLLSSFSATTATGLSRLLPELIQKTILESDPKTGKDKWVSPRTKNEMARSMIGAVKQKQVSFRYVLADIWFSSAENMTYIKCKDSNRFYETPRTQNFSSNARYHSLTA